MYSRKYTVNYTLMINGVETEISTIVAFGKPVKDEEEIYYKAEKYLNETFGIPLDTLKNAYDYSFHSHGE